MELAVYPEIAQKLREKHQVSIAEVEEAFLNRVGRFLKELRPQHQGSDPRFWFISETDECRKLKVVFVNDPTEPAPVIITAYEPNEAEDEEYEKLQEEKGRGTP